jgi:hypothetical protein
MAARHVGGGAGLVDEDEAARVERRLPPDEGTPGVGDIGTVLLGGMQALFLSVSLLTSRKRHTVVSPTVTPCSAFSRARISANVRSGSRATNRSTASRWPVRRELRSPPIARAAAWPSARQRCAQRIAVLTLTPNQTAADLADRPAATAAITRSLKSCEYGAGISPPSNMLRPHTRSSAKSWESLLYDSIRSETALEICKSDKPTV